MARFLVGAFPLVVLRLPCPDPVACQLDRMVEFLFQELFGRQGGAVLRDADVADIVRAVKELLAE